MPEQTTTTGQNPFNLIDQDIAMAENAAENTNTTDNNVDNTANNTDGTTQSAQPTQEAPKEDIFDKLIMKFVKFLAKISWQPDPESGKANTTEKTAKTTQDNANATNNSQTWKVDFDSVMSGVSWFMDKVSQAKVVTNVTWFLDKVWNKIEEKTWINLDSIGWKVNESQPNQTEKKEDTTQTENTNTESTANTPETPTVAQ